MVAAAGIYAGSETQSLQISFVKRLRHTAVGSGGGSNFEPELAAFDPTARILAPTWPVWGWWGRHYRKGASGFRFGVSLFSRDSSFYGTLGTGMAEPYPSWLPAPAFNGFGGRRLSTYLTGNFAGNEVDVVPGFHAPR